MEVEKRQPPKGLKHTAKRINKEYATQFSPTFYTALANSFRAACRVINLANEERLVVTFRRDTREVYLQDHLFYVASQTHYTHRDQ